MCARTSADGLAEVSSKVIRPRIIPNAAEGAKGPCSTWRGQVSSCWRFVRPRSAVILIGQLGVPALPAGLPGDGGVAECDDSDEELAELFR